MKRIVIAGDSHVVALARALNGEAGPLEVAGDVSVAKIARSPRLTRTFAKSDGKRLEFLDSEMAGALQPALGRGWIHQSEDADIAFGFSMGFVTTLLCRGLAKKRMVPWDIRTPAALEDEVNRLSDQAVDELVLAYTAPVQDFLSQAQALKLNFVVIEAPPPHYRDPSRNAGLGRRFHLAADRRCRTVVRDRLTEMGITVVSPPAEAVETGFRAGALKPEFQTDRPGDHHHANAAYGAIMLPRVIEALKAA